MPVLSVALTARALACSAPLLLSVASLALGEASLAIETEGSEPPRITIGDGANGSWQLQSSADLKTWTEVEAVKVHNGSFSIRTAALPSATGSFYRAVSPEGENALASTVDEALALAAIAPNYAQLNLPAHLLVATIVAQDNEPVTNPVTDAGAELGRVLFYDQRLSRNGSISCASCHQAEHGFSDPRPFSVGFAGGLTGRNSMGLASARYYESGRFFWDERATTLEAQVLAPIQDEVEMGMTLDEVVTRVAAEPFYATLFTRAFGTAQVTADRISRALAQFVRSIVSTQSRYDVGVATNFSNFTAEELLGRRIFRGQEGGATCNACHGTDNFVADRTFNNGLENPYIDRGVGALTGRPQDEGRFKAPSLRNIELTAPYMHDGRFETLEEVIEFYSSGVVAHPNLSGPLRAGPPDVVPVTPLRLNLTTVQKAALVAFLKTLTDTAVTTDPRFQDPFKYEP